MKRGSVSKKRAEFVGAWIPLDLIPLFDEAVKRNDTDRSKFIRAALREKLTRTLAEAK